MSELIDVADMNEIPVGRIATRTIGDRKIVLCHTAEGFFALDHTCPHRGGPLGEGDLLGAEIVCPWHLWGFDVRSGVCTGDNETRVTSHEVRVEGGRLLVRLSPAPVESESL